MRPRWAIRLLGAAVSFFLALAAAEVVLRQVVPGWLVRYPPICIFPDLYRPDPAVGYRLWPSKTVEYRFQDRPSTVVRSNAQGFRDDHDFSLEDGRERVVVLGDSMVFAPGVDPRESLTGRLAAAHPGWRVDNVAMPGWGTDLMLRALLTFGLTPTPRAVVLAIYTDDLRRVVPPYQGVGFPLPRFELRDGALATVPYPEPRPWDRLLLVQGVRYALWRYTGVTFPLNRVLVESFAEAARRVGFVPLVAFLPAAEDRWDDRMRRGWLRDVAAEFSLPFVDLTDAVQRAGGAALYLPRDTHWNPAGHAVVAREIGQALEAAMHRAGSGPREGAAQRAARRAPDGTVDGAGSGAPPGG